MDSKIFLDLSEDTLILLDNEHLSIQDILDQGDIDAEVRFEALPSVHPGERTKDLVPMILAGSVGAVSLAAAVAIIMNAISKTVERISGRTRYVEAVEEQPILDAKGNPVLDKDGNVLTIKIPSHKLIELRNRNHESSSFDAGWGRIVVKTESKPGS